MNCKCCVLIGVAWLATFYLISRGVPVVPVVAQNGVSMAVISTEVYSVVVFMAVATTLFTPLLLKTAFRTPALVLAEA
jgi:hypothetical protein